MIRLPRKILFRLHVHGEQEDDFGLFAHFYARAFHLGEAWEMTRRAAQKEGIRHPALMQAAMRSSFRKTGLRHLAQNVWKIPEHYCYPLDNPEPLFVPPDGIVPSMGYDESLSAGFDESTGEDGWVFWRLSSPGDALERDFFEAIRLLPAVLGIGIGIAHHWEETENEFWTDAKDAFTTAEAVTAFFIQHRADTLASGFVDLVVFVPPEGETRLLLTEHKQLQLETRDAALIERFAARFSALGYAKKPEAASCANDVHHWHYRPAATLDRKGFVRFLRRQGFMLRETWAAEEA